jgi:glutathione peroxidase
MCIFEHMLTRNNGEQVSMGDYKGKVLLVVNTASKCGFTKQYEGLESLYASYKQHGFEILAFPCDQFGHQEPGSDGEIAEFCRLNFGVSFPLFKKADVNGENCHPLYKSLKAKAPGILGSKRIKWNFTKFLVSRDGKTVTRFAPTALPKELKPKIEALL